MSSALGVASMGAPLFGANYTNKVLGYGPIAYWIMGENAGAVSFDATPNGRNGAYTGVTLGQAGIGDGNTCPFWDGANDYNNVYSVSLRDAFNGGELTAIAWAKVNAAGVWTDTATRYLLRFRADNDNQVLMNKRDVNNTFRLRYEANNVPRNVDVGGLSSTDWMHWAITASASADEVRGFLDGAQQGATLNGLGVWAGNLSSSTTCIGSADTVPTLVWHGYIAHVAVWDRVLTPTQIADLAVR